jgi:SulP family sulfate permease
MHVRLPRSIKCLKGYSTRALGRDALAGVAVALVALPLAMAFAIASGVPPQAGLYTAVVAGFLISALGGSRTQIGGPTGAFVVIVASVIAKYGLNGLALAGMMSGCLLLIAGITGLASAVKYIPRPVIVGFTNGIAVLIASTQLKDAFGLRVQHVPGDLAGRITALAAHADTVNWTALAVACGALGIIVLWSRFKTMLPGTIVAIAICTVVVAWLHLPVETIGSAFGGIPQGPPPFTPPHWQPELVGALVPTAFTLAFLAAVESLLSAVVADNLTGDRHDSNAEIIAQGIANIASPLFGGIPATGAIARTATSIRAGAQSPVAGMIHALALLLVLLFAAPLARFIPLAALAAVLMNVAYHMGEWRHIAAIVRLSKADIAVWLTTFALTALVDLTVAVGVGMSLAALLYIYRIAETTTVASVTDQVLADSRNHALRDLDIPAYVSVLRINGPFLFGATEKLDSATTDLSAFNETVILRLRGVTALDATGAYALERFGERLHASGRSLLLCGVGTQPERLLRGSHFLERLGSENVLPDIRSALDRAAQLHASGLSAALFITSSESGDSVERR